MKIKISINSFWFAIFFVGFLLPQTSFSQKNFIPGYVINHTGDSIWGYIDYRNWGTNPHQVNFKVQPENSSEIFVVSELKEFGVNNEIYVSAIVQTEISSVDDNSLDEDSELKFQTDTAFLITLIRGEKSLFYYKTTNGKDNFYIKNGDNFELLKYKRYEINADKDANGKYYAAECTKYLEQLMYYLLECSSVQSKLENTQYSKESLIKAFEYYYDCTNKKVNYRATKEKIKVEFGLKSGVSFSTLECSSGVYYEHLVGADFDESINPSLGFLVDIVFPKYHGKWSIYNELLYSSYNTSGNFEIIESDNVYEKGTINLGGSYLKLNNMIRYKHPLGKSFIFVNGGISNGFALSEKNYKKVVAKFYVDEKVEEVKALDDFRKYEQGLLVGTGCLLNKLSFEIRYEIGNGMSDSVILNTKSKRFFILFGYRF